MTATEQPQQGERTESQFGGPFTVGVLIAMALVLGYVRFMLLPEQDRGEPVTFDFVNPMLDAVPGEKVLVRGRDDPGLESCVVVRKEAVVVRPHRGADRIGSLRDLRQQMPFLACSLRPVEAGGKGCGGTEKEQDVILYGLSKFGMPVDSEVRVLSIKPSLMQWRDRELVVYEVNFERYGPLAGIWTTYLAREAPVAGLVKMVHLPADRKRPMFEVHYRDLVGVDSGGG